jgi:hypothetical protein
MASSSPAYPGQVTAASLTSELVGVRRVLDGRMVKIGRRRRRHCPANEIDLYRVKKPGEPASTRHRAPATIILHSLNPRAA